MGAVVPFPPLYRIGSSAGDVSGLVEDEDERPLTFRRFDNARRALELMRLQYPDLVFWISWRPNGYETR